MTIQAIETIWPWPDGDRFRSRLEARWAVFFAALGVQYEYEPEGFDLGDAGWYLPDFWLPQYEWWCEVKSDAADQSELQKPVQLAKAFANKSPVLILNYASRFRGGGIVTYTQDSWWPNAFLWGRCSRCGRLAVRLFNPDEGIPPFYDVCNSDTCCRINPEKSVATLDTGCKWLQNARIAARQARFEHGESPF